jgi:hypothetical protein
MARLLPQTSVNRRLFVGDSYLCLYNLPIPTLGEGMNTDQVIRELEEKRSRLDAAIDALRTLERIASSGKSGNGRRRKRYVSAEARRRMSQAQTKRWAAARKKKK